MAELTQPRASQGCVLVVDDLPANLNLLARLLGREGYSVLAAQGALEALDAVSTHQPDLVITDVVMPQIDGFELCRLIKNDPATRLTPVVLVTGLEDRASRIKGIEAGADDFLGKPVDPQELIARVRSLVTLKRHTDDLDSAEAVIISLALTVEARDPNTNGHCQRLSAYGVELGSRIGLSDEDLAALRRGGALHDLGKVGIPDSILLKPGRLTPSEFEHMKTHAAIGDRMCGNLRFLRHVRPIVRHHHERLDGSGYPDGLRGDQIPLLAQIMGIVDVYDALTTVRPYKPAYPPQHAIDELLLDVERGRFRRDLVHAFLEPRPDEILMAPHEVAS